MDHKEALKKLQEETGITNKEELLRFLVEKNVLRKKSTDELFSDFMHGNQEKANE